MSISYKKLVLGLTLIIGFSIQAQERVSKKIEKTYAMTNANGLNLDHKYGDININGWEKDSIAIVVNIEVTHKKREEADKLLDRIQLSTKMVGELIDISTKLQEQNSSAFSRYFNKANPIDLDKSHINIDYTIYLPKSVTIAISNKFGDVILTDWNGKLSANTQHGDIWLTNDLTTATIEMKFGKIRSKSIEFGNLILKNAELDLKFSKNLILNSSGSTIDIEKVSSLEIDSSKDKVKVLNVESIGGVLNFTDVQLDTVKETIDLKMKVTELKVSNIGVPHAYINIEQESSDININISGLAFKFKAFIEQGVIRIPRSFQNIQTDMVDKSRKLRQISASYGEKPLGKVTITGKKGNIVLRDSSVE